MNELKPFLKWAGGKRWLLQQYPALKPTNYRRYIEPFLGGGAFFFSTQPDEAILSDLNADLVDTYRAIRGDWEKVVEGLEVQQKLHSREHYYEMRKSAPADLVGRAVRFIYLNRTCWNGLYRVNLKGQFNVPIGTKTNVVLDDNFEEVSKLLQNANLYVSDFENTIDQAQEGDFVFVDPPYTVHHNTNGFLKYNQHLFSWDDQLRLRDAVLRASSRGAEILVTNAAHISVKELYSEIGNLVEVDRASVISGKSTGRGRQKEIVVKV